ncbi:ankyrin repeat domain-containing protein [Paraburkholderia sp. SIMBA_055]|jgi:ankyrin repeat protein
MRVLLNAGADVNVRHVQGLTPLTQALIWHCEIDIVRTLLAANADVHAVTNEGDTVLGFALTRYSPQWERADERTQKITGAIRALLAAGLKITKPAEGRQAITFARSAQQEDLVDLLIDAGAKKS